MDRLTLGTTEENLQEFRNNLTPISCQGLEHEDGKTEMLNKTSKQEAGLQALETAHLSAC